MNARSRLRFNYSLPKNIFWLPLLVLLVHSTDELITGFPAWATEHFGITTPAFFIYTHLFLTLFVGTISYFAVKHGSFWKVLAAIAMVQFTVNALFHAISSILFQELTPGIITALIVSLPVSYLFFRIILKRKLLAEHEIVVSTIIGSIIALLIIMSLWLEGNL